MQMQLITWFVSAVEESEFLSPNPRLLPPYPVGFSRFLSLRLVYDCDMPLLKMHINHPTSEVPKSFQEVYNRCLSMGI